MCLLVSQFVSLMHLAIFWECLSKPDAVVFGGDTVPHRINVALHEWSVTKLTYLVTLIVSHLKQ